MDSHCVVSHKVTSDIDVKFDWKIVEWPKIQLSRDLVAQQIKVVEAGSSRWEFYFLEDGPEHSMMYLKLIQLTDAPKAVVAATVQLLDAEGDAHHSNEIAYFDFVVDTPGVEVGVKLVFRLSEDDPLWLQFITAKNELVHRITMTVTYQMNHGPSLVISQLWHASLSRLQDNFETLLGEEKFQNFKIIAKDGKELMVNKHILASRCPIFESMFRSNMEETKTGQVHVKDVSGAAMEILIQFWYTGKLADNWKEPGVVLDFTSAVGKYGIPELLDFLDRALGKEEVVQSFLELAEMAKKLGLKNAEKGLVKNLGRKTAGAETVDELYVALGMSE